ncbi:TetR/AcrR family transcriptional regulator [[Mycobacterium] kokjensenii]|uniref:TetR/AcrR family transcriptional regulator n=1 Tax=[Mycobacterium] kokjensenii TaxID=3064287 RepID=A0ABM9LTK3_9MYCO|nr:TetR/AcrR family transcriptional regulator [Mycolicibacter sp. MU0083]CAJ1504540.1 TetR/AcrR family transcriptional regulator [Mycolicibacter sp. MU0083]
MAVTTTETPAGRKIRGLDAEQRRAQRRTQLLDAAFDLFARDGYTNTSIEQICQTAYVGNKAFYELFDSKEDCFLALLSEIGERIKEQVSEELKDAVDDTEEGTARRVLTVFARALVEDPRVAVVSFRECTGISQRVEDLRRENRQWAAAALEAFWRSHAKTGDVVDYRAMAVATVGGLFETIADFLHPSDPARSMDDLTRDLAAFVIAVGRGIHQRS